LKKLELDNDFLKKDKYLFVGKNGSGKTTVLEIVRLGLTLNNSTNGANQHYFTFLRDNTKPANIEISLELDDEELEICKSYLESLVNEGAPNWNFRTL
jgi:predicted ATP-binding protein involved in virulence